eukprot:4953232-Prymnesium_polylepis.1
MGLLPASKTHTFIETQPQRRPGSAARPARADLGAPNCYLAETSVSTERRLVSDGRCCHIVLDHTISTIGALRRNASCWTGYRHPNHRLYTTMYLDFT